MEENMNTYNCLINNINYTIILFIFLDGYWTDIGRILDGYSKTYLFTICLNTFSPRSFVSSVPI